MIVELELTEKEIEDIKYFVNDKRNVVTEEDIAEDLKRFIKYFESTIKGY